MLHKIDEIDRKILSLHDSLDLSDRLCFSKAELDKICKLKNGRAAILSEMRSIVTKLLAE